MLRIDSIGSKQVLMESDIPFLKIFKKGKVREVYEIGDNLLIIATDRISAFDVVMKSGIPGKGVFLTLQSGFWFRFLEKNGFLTHYISDDIAEIAGITGENRLLELEWLKGRTMLCKKAALLPVEAVCRFRVFGSAIPALKNNQWIWDKIELEDGILEEGALIKNGPVFTPTEKSETDDKITVSQVEKILGSKEMADEMQKKTIEIFKAANAYAKKDFGFEIADGKIEFGMRDNKMIVIDETFTSDSARFIPDKSKEVFRKWLTDNNLKGKAAEVPDAMALKISSLYESQCEDMGLL